MKIKTNLRAGSGGASGAGKNSTTSDPIVYLVGGQFTTVPVNSIFTRCVGI
jgi:hypothetical protein